MPDTFPTNTEATPPSWVTLPEPAPSRDVQALLDRTQEKLGYIRNGQRALLARPDLLLAQDALSRAVNGNAASDLSPKERELIALVVSSENRCEPCVVGHAAALRGITGDPFWVERVQVNFRHAGLSARELALADYALKITRAPGAIEESDLDLLLATGLSKAEILDAAAIAAYFNFSNRINSALGVTPNPEAYAAHR